MLSVKDEIKLCNMPKDLMNGQNWPLNLVYKDLSVKFTACKHFSLFLKSKKYIEMFWLSNESYLHLITQPLFLQLSNS